MTHNGPVIWGGCVTRREHRVGSCYYSQKAVRVQGFNCWQMSVTGRKSHYKLSGAQEQKQKG